MSERKITLRDVARAIQKAIKENRITGKEEVFFIAIDNDRGATPADIRVESVPGGRVKVYDYPETPELPVQSRVKKLTKKKKRSRNAKVRTDGI